MLSRNFVSVTLVVCAILLFNDYADAMTMEQIENMARGIRNVCIGKTGVDQALVHGIKNGEFPDDETLQCYINCVGSTMKVFKNGKPQLDILLKQVRLMPVELQDRLIAAARHCVTMDFSDEPCRSAWEFIRCEYNHDPTAFFFP